MSYPHHNSYTDCEYVLTDSSYTIAKDQPPPVEVLLVDNYFPCDLGDLGDLGYLDFLIDEEDFHCFLDKVEVFDNNTKDSKKVVSPKVKKLENSDISVLIKSLEQIQEINIDEVKDASLVGTAVGIQLRESGLSALNVLEQTFGNDELRETLTLPEVAPVLFTGKQAESLDFLEKHYGQYLSYFGAEKDVLFQYQLKALDPKLLTSVKNRISYLFRRGELNKNIPDILPPKSKETDLLISQVSGRVRSLGSTINTRKHRHKS